MTQQYLSRLLSGRERRRQHHPRLFDQGGDWGSARGWIDGSYGGLRFDSSASSSVDT